jgi:small subunit ribosomal protein S6
VRIYDTTFIVNPQTDDASIGKQVRAVSDLITNNGGRILDENRMGTRRLAYPIDGLTQGYYTAIKFAGPIGILPALDRHFHLGEAYMRHLTILYEGDVKAFTERKEAAAETGERPKEAKPATPEAVEESAEAAEEAGAEEEEKPAASGESSESAKPAEVETAEEEEEEEEEL